MWVLVGAGVSACALLAFGFAIVHSGPQPARPASGRLGSPAAAPEDSGSPTGTPTSSTPAASASRPAGPTPNPSATAPGGGSSPTAGLHRYQDSYKVQQPYDLAVADRFSVTAGPTYSAWILKGDKPFSPGSGTGPRTEMRWGNWSDVEHMWEADVMVDPGTTGTAIMQVKSNDGFEPVYVNVKGNGDLYNDSNRTVLVSCVRGSMN
jgi:hypothetical protein